MEAEYNEDDDFDEKSLAEHEREQQEILEDIQRRDEVRNQLMGDDAFEGMGDGGDGTRWDDPILGISYIVDRAKDDEERRDAAGPGEEENRASANTDTGASEVVQQPDVETISGILENAQESLLGEEGGSASASGSVQPQPSISTRKSKEPANAEEEIESVADHGNELDQPEDNVEEIEKDKRVAFEFNARLVYAFMSYPECDSKRLMSRKKSVRHVLENLAT